VPYKNLGLRPEYRFRGWVLRRKPNGNRHSRDESRPAWRIVKRGPRNGLHHPDRQIGRYGDGAAGGNL
jgi:hypothetical protein